MFDPVTLDNLALRSRIVLSPFIENQAQKNGTVSAQMMDYYLDMAREGVGLVIIESAYVAQQGRAHANQLGINSERHLEGMQKLVKALQSEGPVSGVDYAPNNLGFNGILAICVELHLQFMIQV